MTTKPRPGELVRDYVERCAAELLRRAGASESEVSDYADIFAGIPNWSGVHTFRGWTPSDAALWLNEWRAERRELAQLTREDRERRINAGYALNCSPVGAPVYLNGVAAW